jgi:hypothetical protein
MNVNFFDPLCQTTTQSSVFGICDDTPPPSKPAYIDAIDRNKWIATVENTNQRELIFVAIDNCIKIFRSDGSMDSRCDAMLAFQDTIIFVELKDRQSSGWLAKGESQLKNMIALFTANYDISAYKFRNAYLSNKSKPNFQSGQMTRIQKFKNDTGFILKISTVITIL